MSTKRISMTKPNDPMLLVQHGYSPAEQQAEWLRGLADDIEGRRRPDWWVSISITINKRQVDTEKLVSLRQTVKQHRKSELAGTDV